MRTKLLVITFAGAALICFGIGIGISISQRDGPAEAPTSPQSLAAAEPVSTATSYSTSNGVPTFTSPPPPLPGDIITAPVTPHEPYNFGPVQRAVDNGESVSLGAGEPVVVDENGNVVQAPEQPIGRNGLRSNPPVDPPSSHGAAYSRAY